MCAQAGRRSAAALAWAVVAALPVNAQAPSWAVSGVEVVVGIDSVGAMVHERFTLGAIPPDLAFEVLQVPCARLAQLVILANGAPLDVEGTDAGPWTRLRIGGQGLGTVPLELEVILYFEFSAQEVGVPLVIPAAVLRDSGPHAAIGAPVVLVVQFADDGAASRVLLPRLTANDNGRRGRWTGQMVAMPTVLRIATGRQSVARECREPVAADMDSGGFERVLLAFVSTLALWIPLYFVWVRRSSVGKYNA